MKILLVGATGTIGTAIAAALEAAGDEVVRVGNSGGDFTLDLGDSRAVRELYANVGPLDAVVCAAGLARFGSVALTTPRH